MYYLFAVFFSRNELIIWLGDFWEYFATFDHRWGDLNEDFPTTPLAIKIELKGIAENVSDTLNTCENC